MPVRRIRFVCLGLLTLLVLAACAAPPPTAQRTVAVVNPPTSRAQGAPTAAQTQAVTATQPPATKTLAPSATPQVTTTPTATPSVTTAAGTETPAGTGQPAANRLCTTIGAGTKPDWSICRSQKFNFIVQFPAAAKPGDQSDITTRIDLPVRPGTNLTEKYLQIDAAENPAACTSPLGAGYPPEMLKTGKVTLNNIEFLKESGEDAGAGNRYTWIAYSTSQNGVCVSLSFVLHSFVAELMPTPPPEYDLAAESAVFEQISSTFQWTK